MIPQLADTVRACSRSRSRRSYSYLAPKQRAPPSRCCRCCARLGGSSSPCICTDVAGRACGQTLLSRRRVRPPKPLPLVRRRGSSARCAIPLLVTTIRAGIAGGGGDANALIVNRAEPTPARAQTTRALPVPLRAERGTPHRHEAMPPTALLAASRAAGAPGSVIVALHRTPAGTTAAVIRTLPPAFPTARPAHANAWRAPVGRVLVTARRVGGAHRERPTGDDPTPVLWTVRLPVGT